MKPPSHERGMTNSLSRDACCWKWWIMSFFLTLSSACKSKTHSLRLPVNITPLHIIAPLMLCCRCRRCHPQHLSMWWMCVLNKKPLARQTRCDESQLNSFAKFVIQISWRCLLIEWKQTWKWSNRSSKPMEYSHPKNTSIIWVGSFCKVFEISYVLCWSGQLCFRHARRQETCKGFIIALLLKLLQRNASNKRTLAHNGLIF